MIRRILAIETSCDDTSVAFLDHEGKVLRMLSQSQDDNHRPFGGVVPEIAGRNHSVHLLNLIEKITLLEGVQLNDIDAIAVTNRPGLVASLIVGIVTAKALAQSLAIPLIGVNHLEGHIVAPFLKDDDYQPSFGFDEPNVTLAVSGGHSSIYLVHKWADYTILGSTLDDAAGEAFDKFGKMLGLGFPGGVLVDRHAKLGNPKAFDFPRSMIREKNLMMSFSGLKAAGQRLLETMTNEDKQKNANDLCASYQQAIIDILIAKLDLAVQQTKVKKVVITGGVSANSGLRKAVDEWSQKRRISYMIPPLKYCTDNAAMIGLAGLWKLQNGITSELSMGPSPTSYETDFKL